METKDYIKKRRKDLGLTLEQVGEHVGVKKGTVQKWESGYISDIGRTKIAKLSEILQISPLDIIYDEINIPHNISLHNNHVKKKQPNDSKLNKIIEFYNTSDETGKEALLEQAEFIQSKHPINKSKNIEEDHSLLTSKPESKIG